MPLVFTPIDAAVLARGITNAAARGSDGLWLSTESRRQQHAGSLAADLERHADAHRGVGGIVYLLSRLALRGPPAPAVVAQTETAVRWLTGQQPTLPGLFFGSAGMALALGRSVEAGLVGGDEALSAVERWLSAETFDWPDITHGAAGQGLAALRCARIFDRPTLGLAARAAAAHLMETQHPDGWWRLPPGVDGMSGQILTGFAHGVAGISYFLAAHAAETDDQPSLDAARRGADWLLTIGEPGEARGAESGSLCWPYALDVPQPWQWWCHGSAGIALLFLKLFETTEEQRWADAARGALAYSRLVPGVNLGLCHGLAGCGEIWLEAWRVLGDIEALRKAQEIGAVIQAQAGGPHGAKAPTWLVESEWSPTADLMTGGGGIAHFLNNLALGDRGVGFPLLR